MRHAERGHASVTDSARRSQTTPAAVRLNCWDDEAFLPSAAFALHVSHMPPAGRRRRNSATEEAHSDKAGCPRRWPKNHRLILKDGTYQVVRQYQVVGDRVRYMSLERGGDWEELPADLVDWPATEKWEKSHAEQPEDTSPAMKEAEDIDKEAIAERVEELQRRPEVAKGLELPDSDGVFVLDIFQGAPELVERSYLQNWESIPKNKKRDEHVESTGGSEGES